MQRVQLPPRPRRVKVIEIELIIDSLYLDREQSFRNLLATELDVHLVVAGLAQHVVDVEDALLFDNLDCDLTGKDITNKLVWIYSKMFAWIVVLSCLLV